MSTDDIWNEIDAVYKLPERLPDDIDSKQLAKRHGVSSDTAMRRMHKLVDTGEYEFITVRDANRQQGKCLVIRKIK